ncbi:hypothetical protein DB345_09870 [Spartobacteria bacterium LR76]|nr:hypothetical protein DB345_09870 [Spartobacteria bacterium LR76]
MNASLASVEAVSVTQGAGHHFFGYYDKSCWDAGGRWILGQESGFMHRPPGENDVLKIGMIDTANGCEWMPLAETRAWNWQQGCMLQWLGTSRKVIFNDRKDGRYVARILDTATGKEQVIDRPVYGVNREGTYAVSVNFSRLHHQRPGYGYAGVPDPWKEEGEPEEDGIFAVDLQTGESRLILSTAEAAAFLRNASFEGKTHRFNHLQFGANGRRFAFLHRYKTPEEEVGSTRLMTMDIDGKNLCCLSDHQLVSHYDWRGSDGILAWANRNGSGAHYYYFRDQSSQIEMVGDGDLACDGHCSFSPDGKWVLTDTYPDTEHYRTLLLYGWERRERIDIGKFLSPPMEWQIRCDLHPRWNRDGRKICIDSLHEGRRQMYVLDVSEIVLSGDFA